jgi:hypothetical protein
MADKPQTISSLDALRRNRVGALISGLIVTVAVALILSAAVPDDLNTAIAILLILLLAVAVGFTVKVTSPKQDGPMMLAAGSLAAIGVPILFGAGGAGVVATSDIAPLVLGGPSFDQAILSSLMDGYLTVGSALAAVVAITVAAWGARSK